MDLVAIKSACPVSAQRIVAVLEQMEGDELMQDTLLDHHGQYKGVEVQQWVSQHRLGNDYWRIKVFSVGDHNSPLKYRIIYAYILPNSFDPKGSFLVLGIVHRSEFNYEHDNRYTQRFHEDMERYS